MEVFSDWLVKLLVHLEKLEKDIQKRKLRKLRKIMKGNNVGQAVERFYDHCDVFGFIKDLYVFAENVNEDIPNLVALKLLGSSFMEENYGGGNDATTTNTNNGNNVLIEDSQITNEQSNSCEMENNRYIGKFVSSNVVNLSRRNLTTDEISLLSKGLKFVPTPFSVNKAILKEELERFGRFLRLKWFFRNEESNENYNRFKKKSKFNPKGKDASIEIYLSRLEEEIMNLDFHLKYHNLSKGERAALKSLKDDTSIVIKQADKGSAVVVWDRDDYLRKAESQPGDSKMTLSARLLRLSSIISKELGSKVMFVKKLWNSFLMKTRGSVVFTFYQKFIND